MVVRAVRVRAAGDDRVEAVGHDVALHEQLAGGLGRGVRRARRERRRSRSSARSRRCRRPRRSRPAGSAADASAVRHASSRTWTPMTPVRRNASGSRMERSTCDSAAKLTTASASATSGPTTAGSAMSPCTKRSRAACSGSARTGARFGLVAGVGQLVEDGDARAVAAGRGRRGRRPLPMNPAPPVTSSSLGTRGAAGSAKRVAPPAAARRPASSSSRAISAARRSDGDRARRRSSGPRRRG